MCIYTDIYKIIKFEILWDLPQCNRDMKRANVVGKNGINRLAWHTATNLQFVKKTVSAKYNT